jgi:hypothetical protein
MTGQRFTRLLVLSRADSDSNGNARWNCACDCGASTVSSGFTLRNGESKSCGCLTGEQAAERNYRHGMAGGPEYLSWASMIQRCTNPKAIRYQRYGGRGISVCERWQTFNNFYADMGLRPSIGHTLERKDNDKNYEPSNCKWATKQEQNHNKCNNRYVIYKGKKMTLMQAKDLANSGITYGGIRWRLRNGWTLENAIETPPDPSVWANRTRKLKPA